MPAGPFAPDHVGSLLRPDYLKEARAKAATGAISADDLRAMEDRAIKEAVALQVAAGLQAITDGEFRRAFWHVDFLTSFDGVEATQSDYAVSFKGQGRRADVNEIHAFGDGQGEALASNHARLVRVPAQRDDTHAESVHPIAHLHASARRTQSGGGRRLPDAEEFWADMIAAYREEVQDLADAGLTYLQLDDVSFATMCDEGVRAQMRADGMNPEDLPAKYARIVSDIVAQRPAGMTVTMHTCRGNHESMWMAEGGYDSVADAMLN